MKILICGLPDSGKTTLARELAYHFIIPHHNGDTYREYTNNYDHSYSGRHKQATLMSRQWGILDFVCPTEYLRNIVRPNYTIFMNTVDESKYEDTNKIFEEPLSCDFEVTEWIELNQLHKCLGDFNPGITGIQTFLEEGLPELVK